MPDLTLKPVLFENIVVGERFLDQLVTIDDNYVKAHAFATDDYHPWHFSGDGSPFGRRVAPSTALLNELLRLLNTLYDPHFDRGLHQREEFWIESPAFVGEIVRLSGGITGTYTRRGRNYFVAEAEARSEADGRLILRHVAIEAAEVGDPSKLGGGTAESASSTSRQIVGVYPADAVAVDSITAGTPVGTPLPIIHKHLDQSQVAVYSNVAAFWRTPHTDIEVATAEGLPGTIAQGMMEASYVAELGLKAFGPSWFTTGHGELAFIGPMYPGMGIDVKAVVSAVGAGPAGDRTEIETWVEDSATGAKICVGWLDAIAQ